MAGQIDDQKDDISIFTRLRCSLLHSVWPAQFSQ